AVGLGQAHPIRNAWEVDRAEPLLVDDPLPLPDHTVAAVVDDDSLDRQPLGEAGGELLAVHGERAVAVDVDHEPAGIRRLDSHRGRQTVTHRAEPPGRSPHARALEPALLTRPHLERASAR